MFIKMEKKNIVAKLTCVTPPSVNVGQRVNEESSKRANASSSTNNTAITSGGDCPFGHGGNINSSGSGLKTFSSQ